MTVSRTEFDALRREVHRLRSDLARRPARPNPGGGIAAVYTLRITGGNVLSDGSTQGIRWASPAITSVPSAYNPNVDTSFIDGIGRGILFIDGTQQSGFVLIAHHAGNGTGLTIALPTTNEVLTSQVTVAIAVAGDPDGATVSCYLPFTR